MNPAANRQLRVALRGVVGLLFLWAAVSKLGNPTEFLGALYAYELPISRGALKLAAVVLPWTELLCGLMLLADFRTRSALVCTLGMIAVFLAATGQAWARGLEISCGCFDLSFLGQGKTATSVRLALESVPSAFLRNLLIATACFWMLRKNPLPGQSAARVEPAS
jgi:uncharacterized membrane protein YphA (DoxX/SURF4 family)